jgi:hypothetical protein
MIRAVANLLLPWIPREFIGNAQTMQIQADSLIIVAIQLKPAVHQGTEPSQAAERDARTRSTAHCLISDFTQATARGPRWTGAGKLFSLIRA